jgi:hypothetical protein
MLWQDQSGARLVVFLMRKDQIECAKPTFAGTSRMLVRPVTTLPDPDGCPFCLISSVEVLENGAMVYPLFLELDDIHHGPLVTGTPIQLSVVGFAEELKVWPDLASYKAADTKFAEHSLIPSGMFRPDGGERPARAEAILTGVVTKAERRRNRHSDALFDWCTVETLAAEIDIVAALQAQPFEVGNILQGTFWLIASRPEMGNNQRPVLWRRLAGILSRD